MTEGRVGLHEGYASWSSGAVEAFACEAASEWLRSTLAGGSTLHEWAAASRGSRALRGRGVVHAIKAPAPGPDHREEWAVRHYHRGGALAGYLGDRYLVGGLTRPVRELRASVEARARGVPTPAVVAGAVYRTGLVYRADLVTELVPSTVSLADALFSTDQTLGRADSLAAAASLVLSLEEHRVLHADLNAGNVLLSSAGDTLTAHVIDLDRCCVLPVQAARPSRSMRQRLERSLLKLGKHHGRSLSASEWDALRAGFDGPA